MDKQEFQQELSEIVEKVNAIFAKVLGFLGKSIHAINQVPLSGCAWIILAIFLVFFAPSWAINVLIVLIAAAVLSKRQTKTVLLSQTPPPAEVARYREGLLGLETRLALMETALSRERFVRQYLGLIYAGSMTADHYLLINGLPEGWLLWVKGDIVQTENTWWAREFSTELRNLVVVDPAGKQFQLELKNAAPGSAIEVYFALSHLQVSPILGLTPNFRNEITCMAYSVLSPRWQKLHIQQEQVGTIKIDPPKTGPSSPLVPPTLSKSTLGQPVPLKVGPFSTDIPPTKEGTDTADNRPQRSLRERLFAEEPKIDESVDTKPGTAIES